MNVRRQLLVYGALIVGSAILVELLGFAGLMAIDLAGGTKWDAALSNRAREHPLLTRATEYCPFDPLQRVFCVRGTQFNGLEINEYGFYHNGPKAQPLGEFPRKPDNVFRILLYGGSSAAGLGLSRNEDTIAANLEQRLNERRAPSGPRYQVINLANGGYNTYSELNRFLGEGIHYAPDMLVFLDGWNDGIMSFFEFERQGLPHAMLNWDELSYGLYARMNGLDARNVRPPPVFTYAFLLVNRLTWSADEQRERRLAAFRRHPLWEISNRVLADQSGEPAYLQRKHLSVAAAYARESAIRMLAYLQPWPGQRIALSPAAEKLQDDFHRAYAGTWGRRWERTEFNRLMVQHFDSAALAYAALDRQFTAGSVVRFFDLRDVFSAVREDAYLDIIHYNPRGAKVIADRIARDVQEALSGSVATNRQH